MALAPDVVAEFVIGPFCPPDDVLEELARQFQESLPDVPLTPGSLALCSMNATVGTNVVKIGVWTDTDGSTDVERQQALSELTLLTSNRTAALLITLHAIRVIAESQWADVDKDQGRVTLGEEIEVTIADGKLVSVVRGRYDPPVLPSVGFTFTARDTLSLASPGASPALSNDMSTNVDVSTGGALGTAFLIGILSPILGAIVFFGADTIASSQVPKKEGVGDSLAAQWPPHILTALEPAPLTGKIFLSWTELTVDESGVLTLGTYSFGTREPSVTIRGSTTVAIREALGHSRNTYRLDIADLRSPSISWGGVASGNGRTSTVMFRTAGTHRVGVSIRDLDGLEASDEITVTTTIIELEPGQDPF